MVPQQETWIDALCHTKANLNIVCCSAYLCNAGFGNKNAAQTAINSATFLNGNTNMYEGLSDALSKLSVSSPNNVKLAFLITDGQYNDGGNPTAIANQIKALGVTLVCIGVGNGVDTAFLTGIASPGYYFPVASTSVLVSAIQGIVARVCPMVCTSQSFTITANSNGVCSLPICTTANAGSNCYNVYVSGAQGSPVTQTPAGLAVGASITVGSGVNSATVVTAAYSSQSCTGTVTINCQIPGQCTQNYECNKILDVNMTCGVPTCENKVCVYKVSTERWWLACMLNRHSNGKCVRAGQQKRA